MAQVVRVKNLKNDSFHKNSIHFFFFYEIWSRRLFVIGDRIIYNDEQKRFRTSMYLRKIGITPWPLYPKPNPDHIYILYHFGNNQLS